MVRFLIPNFLGICAFFFIFTQAPHLKAMFFNPSGPSINNLYALPVYLSQILPTGLIGLVTAAMIAAFMSTHDSYLLCWSTVITQDIIAPMRKKTLSVQAKLKITRTIIIIIGGYIWYWGLFYAGTEDVWDYLAVTGAIYFTGAVALLIGGLYWKRASETGAILALLTGFTAILGLRPVQSILGMPAIPGEHIGLVSVGLTCVAMILGSLVFPDKQPRIRETP